MKADWYPTTLKELCVVDWGNTNLIKAAYVDGGKFLAVSAAGCDGRIDHKEHLRHTPVLSAIGAQCGRMFLPKEDFTAIKNTITLTPREGKSIGAFLYYLFTYIKLPQRGAGQPFISKGDIESFNVTCPNIAEQQRIVGILDQALEGIATAKANAENNLQNARALFESHLQSAFTDRRAGWVSTSLKDVTDLITCGVAKRPDYAPGGVPFLSAKNVKSGRVIWHGHQYVSEETHRALTKHNKPKSGDILYTRVGSYGEAAIIDRDVEFSIFVSLTLIKPKDTILNSFLTYYLNSSAVKLLASGSINGSGVGNLNVGTVREFPIYLPNLGEQRSIVSRLDKLSAETQRLKLIYERKLIAIGALKQSLLHQAFSGRL